MMKRKSVFLTGVLMTCLTCGSLSVSAYTADDVAQKAREAGWPETLIQTGYNEWASEKYTQSDLDEAYNSVLDYNEQSEEFICNAFGVDVDKVRQRAAETTPAETTPDETAETGQETTAETSPQDSGRIGQSEFVNMTLEEKTEYINTLNEEEKPEFIASLSTEEKNSILKQLPTEDKIALMKNYVDTAKTMGMNVVVDNISENDISVTVRDDDGIVINKAAVGVVIDETGISHTKPLLIAGFGILTAFAGFGLLYWYASRPEKE